MKEREIKIEQRLQKMKDFYLKAEQIINDLPDGIPDNVKKLLNEKILGDKELKSLIEGIDSHRPPRIFLMGRTGVGKSSLINALCGAYVAKVSDTHSCTSEVNSYPIVDKDGRVLMEVLDTRGIAESVSLDEKLSAENMLINQISEFSPDVAIFMLNCTHRDDVDKDVEFLKKISKKYADVNHLKLPIVVVVNKCDQMAPAREIEPERYSQRKVEKINEVVHYYKGIIVQHGLKIEDIIAVSSLVDWQTSDGMSVAVEDIDNLPKHDIDNLVMEFDGRYNIGELFDILEDAIQDFEAQMGLRMALRLEEQVKRLANHLNNIFSGISATVALTPIPVSDVYILLIVQSFMVTMIAALSGRDISVESAKEFILSVSGVIGAGYIFRLVAQQASKFANTVWPGIGSVISSTIAFSGTSLIGKTAIAYYIDNESMDETKKLFAKNNSSQ